jgi:hypothetical protein
MVLNRIALFILVIVLLFNSCPAKADKGISIKEHTELITEGRHSYKIKMGGTLDGFNTPEFLETYSNNMRLQSKFQPNKYVIIENIGDTDIINPRIVINGRRNWFSADDIITSVTKPGMTDAEKVMALYMFLADHWVQAHENDRRPGPEIPGDESHPSRNDFKERANPVKAVNCYYCGGCQFEATNLVILARHLGFAARPVWLNKPDTYGAHCLAEIFYDGSWHLFDADQRTFYLDTDNTTIASFETLHNNPSLVDRTHDGGFASSGLKKRGSQYAKIWPGHIMAVDTWLSKMDLTLRPGERFIYRWGHIGKYRCGANRRNIKPERPTGLLPYQLANGKLVYQPRFDNAELFHKSVLSELNIKLLKNEFQKGRLQQEITGWPGFVIYKVSSPYPIVGATARAKFFRKSEEDNCKVYLSVHDSNWMEVFSTDITGQFDRSIELDEQLNPLPSPAIYDYYLKFEVNAAKTPGDAWLEQIEIETDVQMAATSLPSLSVGDNIVVYQDTSPKDRKVRITHGWVESSATIPPEPPAKALAPADGKTVKLSELAELVWSQAKDPDGSIVDYHIQVSPRGDFLHPVSPNFDRIIGSAEPKWSVPAGWLLPGRTYYWQVRAKDDWGCWSRWSKTFKFVTIAE